MEQFNVDPKDIQRRAELNKKNQGVPIEGIDKPVSSFFGFDYKYGSDTDEEHLYITPHNERFKKWKKEKRLAHVLKLWKTLFNKALSCSITINQFNIIQTKVYYFGRQMVSVSG